MISHGEMLGIIATEAIDFPGGIHPLGLTKGKAVSWNISKVGTIAGVRKAVESTPTYSPKENEAQCQAAKGFIIAQLDAMAAQPSPKQGIKLDASGHADSSSANVSIKIEQFELAT